MKLYKGTATVEADLNQIATMKAAGWSLYPEIPKPVIKTPLPPTEEMKKTQMPLPVQKAQASQTVKPVLKPTVVNTTKPTVSSNS